jgi:hypothetical protein
VLVLWLLAASRFSWFAMSDGWLIPGGA